ncbi:MAG: restriction endonuclease subunit [Schlesneria sp.]|nr:restriction endonuclease subunit [Schlesneria sp.]
MSDSTRPFACTNGSNIPWLATIPADWGIAGSKRLFAESKEKAWPNDPQLSATQSHGVILQEEYERIVGRKVVRIVQNLDKRRHVEKDDFVISMRSFQGGLERAWCQGAIRSSYVVLKPSAKVWVPYFAHFFKSHPYIQALRATSNFIRDGQDLSFSNFCMVDLPVAPMEEQKVIANYLDAHVRIVNKFIRNRRRLIEVLNEQKQAVIEHAVNRGLNPNVKLKPSGIDWLGDVPTDWTVKRFKVAVQIRSGQVDPKLDQYRQSILISPDHIEKGTGALLQRVTAAEQGAISGKYLVKTGELIYCKIRPALRKAVIAPCDCLCGADMYPLLPSQDLLPEYLLRLILAPRATRYLVECSMRVAMPKVNREALGNFWLCYPDKFTQATILDAIEAELAPLNAATQRAQGEIDLIREYRTRLIADVVTGKLDVRHLAPPPGSLEAEELAGIEADESLDDESAEEDADLVEETFDADAEN